MSSLLLKYTRHTSEKEKDLAIARHYRLRQPAPPSPEKTTPKGRRKNHDLPEKTNPPHPRLPFSTT
jgi:hypothetical protein